MPEVAADGDSHHTSTVRPSGLPFLPDSRPSSPQVRRSLCPSEQGSDVEKGISVLCRIRPLNSKELKDGDACIVTADEEKGYLEVCGSEKLSMTFDAVLGCDGCQEDVYNLAAKPVVDDFLEGFNGTIFAYGQTGSGKTYTMEGMPDEPDRRGIVPRTVCSIFDFMEKAGENMQFMIQVSFMEIYNEKIRDLICPERDNLKVREDKSKGIWVEGVSQHYITTELEVMELLLLSASSRATSETLMNMNSSRSHSIFQIVLEQINTVDGSRKLSKLYMVDLAGSEMCKKTGAQGATLNEAKHINKSLSALSNVIYALSDGKASHIPYRDSKLTRILQEAIGGNCRTALIINCSPARSNEAETVSTIRFGSRAKRIKNRAHINKEQSSAELKVLLAECQRRNKDLAERLAAKEAEVSTLQVLGGQGGDVQGRLMELQEQVLRERRAREAAQRECAEMESRLRDREAELMEQMEEMQSELEARREDSSLGLAPPEPDGPAKHSRAQVEAALARAHDLQRLMEAARGEEKESAALGELSAGLQALVDSLQAAGAGATPTGRDITELEAAKADAENRYQALLGNCTDEYVRQRVLNLEATNAALLRKAREDSRLLEARDLELRIFERKQHTGAQRVQILEMLLADARQRNEKLRTQGDAAGPSTSPSGDGSRRALNTHRPIQGGKGSFTGRQAVRIPLQEGAVDVENSPVAAVRAFIKRITGKETE